MNESISRFVSSLEALRDAILKIDRRDLLPSMVVVVAQTLYQLLQLTTEIIADQRYTLESVRLCLYCGNGEDKLVVTWDEFINEFSGRFESGSSDAGVFNDGIVKFPSVNEHLDYVTKNIDDRIMHLRRDPSDSTRPTAAVALSPISDKDLKQEPSDDLKSQSDADYLSEKEVSSQNDSESIDATPMPLVDRRDPLLKKHLHEQFSRIDHSTLLYGNSFPTQLQVERYETEKTCNGLASASVRCFLCNASEAIYSSCELLEYHIVTNHTSLDSEGRMVVACPRISSGCLWSEPVRSSTPGPILERVVNHLLMEHKMALPDFVYNCAIDIPYLDGHLSRSGDPKRQFFKHTMNAQLLSPDAAADECRSSGVLRSLCTDVALKASSFGCKVQGCGRWFDTRTSLKQHVESAHDVKKRFTCCHCLKAFVQKSKYSRHIVSHHNDQVSTDNCKICNFDFTEPEIRRQFLNDLTRMNPSTAKLTRRSDGSERKTGTPAEESLVPLDDGAELQEDAGTGLNEDALDESDDNQNTLNESNISVSSVKKARLDEEHEHSRNNSNTIHFTRYQCFLCVSSVDVFETSSALFNHVRNVHLHNDGQVNTIECPYCTDTKVVQKGVGSYILSQVLSHMVKKHRIGVPDYIRPFYCPEPNCHFLSIRRYELNAHSQKHLTSDDKVPCEKCGKFMQQRSLGLHAKFCSASTVDREMFKCIACGKVISTKQGLQKHFQNKHENRKDFLCSHCTKAFSGKGELEDHTFRRHGVNISNKPVHHCTLCPFKTILSFSLKRHVSEAHSTTKQHQCNVCSKFFKSPMQLKSHKVAHEERTHPCPMCDYTAARKSNLDAHVKAQHSGVQYRCEKCGYQTGYYANLCKHQRTVCSQQNKAFDI